MTRREFLYAAPALASLGACQDTVAGGLLTDSRAWKLWYRQPATDWLDSLPAGNGRLGAMVFGGTTLERIELNESTVWSGSPNSSNIVPSAHQHLDEIRELFFEGKYAEGNQLCAAYFAGREADFGTHLPMAALTIHNASDTRPRPITVSLILRAG